MKRILVLAGRYFPKASPNSICIQRIMDAFPKDEASFHVICYRDGLCNADSVPTTRINRGIIQSLIYKLESEKGKSKAICLRFLQLVSKAKQLLFIPTWPWNDPMYTFKTLAAAEHIYKEEGFDMVIAVHKPISSLFVAYRLKKRHRDIKYTAYFLDALTGGYVPSFMQERIYNKKAERWERRLLNNADMVVYLESMREITKGIADSASIETRIHYLDLPLLADRNERCSFCDDEISLVYVGTMGLGMRSPLYIIKVFQKAAKENWRLVFVGDASCDVLNAFSAEDRRIKVVGRCTFEEALEYESKAAALVNLGNRNNNPLVPSKVFEYMSFGKKIISTYSADNDSSKSCLQQYPAVLMLDERDPDFDAAAKRLAAFVEEKMEQVPFSYVRSGFKKNTPDAFVELIRQELSERNI